MDTPAMVLGMSNVTMAVTFILLGIPLLKRKVPMNRWYGARFKKSFESEENWYRINAYSAKQLMIWSVPLLLVGIATLFLPLKGHPGITRVLACAPMLIGAPCFLSYRFARKLPDNKMQNKRG